ncbi:MAG: type IV-A pilus assembly ATPase PilB [Deltaproteobacteria bacterium]|nr:type IV-A pilus assembly ATPase PilB [Deltaproteobacteria bacterium]
MPPPPGKLGELLVREKLISPLQLQQAMNEAKKTGQRLGSALISTGAVKEEDLTEFLSRQYGVPTINLDEFEIDREVIALVPEKQARQHKLIPVNRAGSTLIVAMVDPSNIQAVDDIKFVTSYQQIEVVVSTDTAIMAAIDKYYTQIQQAAEANLESLDMPDLSDIELGEDDEDVNLDELGNASNDAPVVKLCNYILTEAIKRKASDIHIEPYEKSFRVRYRQDGDLMEFMKPPMKLKNAITARLKVMANLDIAERRLPQDGRIKIKMKGIGEMDYRVSVLPTLFGEKVCMRLLDKSNLQLDMTKLGFDEYQLGQWRTGIERPNGMCLVTGPTGSGKTTTLYSALSELNSEDVNISTAEDPVEFNFFGINQCQMKEDIGLNFAAALRSFLRQDPDIILVGEIRDFETAEIAIKAALTGHLVLSTLHTNDAPATVSRLLNMGVEPFLVASAVNVILAQRLCKKICQNCKTEDTEITKKALVDFGVPADQVDEFVPFKGAGCDKCNNTGFKGRIAIYEVMPMYSDLKELILNGASSLEIKKEAMRLGMWTMRYSGVVQMRKGLTTMAQVAQNSSPDN